MHQSEQSRFTGNPDHLVRLMEAVKKDELHVWNAWRAQYEGYVHLEG